jgi:uncharacterized protein (TIGR03435 family)
MLIERFWMALLVGAMLLVVANGSGQGVASGTPGGAEAYVPTFTFDVASIRESKPEGGYSVSGYDAPRSSSFTANNFDVRNLITLAYGVEYFQVSGGPDWVHSFSSRFNVQAKADSATDEALAKMSPEHAKLEKQHMLQVLLAERMKLKVHMDSKEASVFTLTVSKSGSKMQPAKDDISAAGAVPAAGGGDGKDPGGSKKPKWTMRCGPRGCEIVAERMSMEALASMLDVQLSTFVTDKTGLTGDYAFTLQYQSPGATGLDDATSWPSLLTAVQEQLGLKLESEKGLMPVLVIDRIEKPSEN